MHILYIIVIITIIIKTSFEIIDCYPTSGSKFYDYSRLTKPKDKPYIFHDEHSASTGYVNATYYINFCQDLYPITFGAIDCSTTRIEGDYDGFLDHTGEASVFYINHRNGKCHRLGGAVNQQSVKITYLDQDDLSKGLLFNYTRGDEICLSNDYSKTCTKPGVYNLEARLNCRKSPFALTMTQSAYVSTYYHKLEIDSNQACGNNCPINGNGEICSGHGMCGWDYDNNNIKCFCNEGLTGSSCQNKLKSTKDPLIIAVVFIGILVVTLAVSIGYIFYKLKKINVSPDAYDNLEKKFNELGQLASS